MTQGRRSGLHLIDSDGLDCGGSVAAQLDVLDSLFDQLIMPKLHSAIADWTPRRGEGSLQSLVFPWLPFVGLRLESLVGDARRKVKSLFRAWTVDQGVPTELMLWEKVLWLLGVACVY